MQKHQKKSCHKINPHNDKSDSRADFFLLQTIEKNRF